MCITQSWKRIKKEKGEEEEKKKKKKHNEKHSHLQYN